MTMKAQNINRILVALDPGFHFSEVDHSILQAATTLAHRLDAELNTLFVEDINLLRLAELPVAREIVYGAASGRKLNVADMERSLTTQTARLRKLVETISQQNQIKIAFDVMRGDIAREVCSASENTDLLVVGKNTQKLRQSLKIGKITKTILSSVSCNLLLLQHGATIERPVAVFFTGSEASHKALQLAIQLVQQDHKNLSVIYPVSTDEESKELTQQVNELTQPLGIEARHIQLKDNSATAMLETISMTGARVLLLDTSKPVFSSEQVQTLIEQTNTPVILIN